MRRYWADHLLLPMGFRRFARAMGLDGHLQSDLKVKSGDLQATCLCEVMGLPASEEGSAENDR
jgi:hypothetical protein